KSVAQVLVDHAGVRVDNLFAGRDPTADQRGELVAGQAATERREVFNIGHEQPTRNVFDLADRPLDHGALVFVRHFDRLSKREDVITDDDLIEITKSHRLMHSAFVQERSVAASQVDHPKLADILDVDN